MARLRYNNLQGSLGASLTNSGTAITFASALTYNGAVNVPTIVAPDYIPLTLEPGSANFEVVSLTAYTAGGTTGTITRGQEGVAVAHNNGVPFVHGGTAVDGVGVWVGCRAFITSGQAITHGVDSVLLNFDAYPTSAAVDNPQSNFSTSTHLYTCPIAGNYLVTASVEMAFAAAQTVLIRLRQNGATYTTLGRTTALDTNVNGSAVVRCAAGDTIGVGMYQGDSVDWTTSTGAIDTHFDVTFIGYS